MKQINNPWIQSKFHGKAILLLASLASCFSFPLNGEDSLEAIQASALKWIDIRLETAQLQSDWSWQKDLLESTVDAIEFKVERLEAEEALLAAQTESDQVKLDESRQEVALLQSQLTEHGEHNQMLIGSLQALRPSLPPRLSDSLDLAFKSLSKTDLPSGERLQLIGTILNRCLQFNNTITYSEEIVPINGQATRKVMSVLYWGLGQAYALDRVKGEAYVGRPGTDSWEWTLAEKAGPEIQQLIDMFQERIDPVLVKTPIHINPSHVE